MAGFLFVGTIEEFLFDLSVSQKASSEIRLIHQRVMAG
jgi:hypothetical protein